MKLAIGQDYYDPNGVRATIVDIYFSWHKDSKLTSVALIERPSGKAVSMSLAEFMATYETRPKERN